MLRRRAAIRRLIARQSGLIDAAGPAGGPTARPARGAARPAARTPRGTARPVWRRRRSRVPRPSSDPPTPPRHPVRPRRRRHRRSTPAPEITAGPRRGHPTSRPWTKFAAIKPSTTSRMPPEIAGGDAFGPFERRPRVGDALRRAERHPERSRTPGRSVRRPRPVARRDRPLRPSTGISGCSSKGRDLDLEPEVGQERRSGPGRGTPTGRGSRSHLDEHRITLGRGRPSPGRSAASLDSTPCSSPRGT